MLASIYKDERIRLSFFIVIMFIVAIIVSFFTINLTLETVNDRYIKQNTEIVGFLNSKNPELAKEIIPIITGKEEGNYNEGKKILDGYSYNNTLNYRENPLFEQGINSNVILSMSILGILTILGSILILNPLFRDIKYLTKRSDEIVENKFDKGKKREGTSRAGALDKLFHKFNIMEDRIQNSIELLSEEKINLKNIINDISHQLKTPITALTMYTDILQDHKNMEADEVDTFIGSSKEQLDRMEWLVLTLLKYARLESNVVKYNKEKIPINNTVEEAIAPLKIKAKAKNQELIFINNRDILYNHDRNWVAEAISNIVKNAIEHTPKNGKIEIEIEETEISIVIGIKDTGSGIEQKELKNIFKRFYKGENSTNPTSIGIGLCLSRMIVRNHSGDITVESEVGKGTTFYIKFLKTV